jgi:uncharacterized SAM-binding protein YcdF (DUF218 family)
MIEKEIEYFAKKIWDYHHLNQKLEKADCILVLGSHDERVAEYGAGLFLSGWAPLIVFSGGLGRLTKEIWDTTEADRFAKIAFEKGVPENKILVENKSTNTGENITFTKGLLKEKGIDPGKFILVQKPYMERRAYATFKKQWPGKEFVVTSPPIKWREYPTKHISRNQVINIMIGDLERIKEYSEKGFQIFQEIPGDVWSAYKKLVAAGYNQELIK